MTGAFLTTAGKRLSTLGSRLTMSLTLPLVIAGGVLAKFGSDADSVSRKLDLTFGPVAARVRQGIEDLRKVMPATTREVTQFVDQFGEMLLNFGFTREKAADMSLQIVKVGNALALFRNKSPEQALIAIRSAMNGLTRPIRDFGVYFPAANHVLGEHASSVSAAARAQIYFDLTLKNSVIQQALAGELLKTTAVKMKFAAANLREARDIIGRQLLPVFAAIAEEISTLAVKLQHLDPETVKMGIHFAVIFALLGPVIKLVGLLSTGIGFLIRVVGALTAENALGALATVLSPQGIILLGLGLLAVAFYAVHEAMNADKNKADKLRESLKRLSEEQLINAGIQRKLVEQQDRAQLKVLQDKNAFGIQRTQAIVGGLTSVSPTAGAIASAILPQETSEMRRLRIEADAARDDLTEINRLLAEMRQPIPKFPHIAPDSGIGTLGKDKKDILDVLQEQGRGLKEMFDNATKSGEGLTQVLELIAKYRAAIIKPVANALVTAQEAYRAASVKNDFVAMFAA